MPARPFVIGGLLLLVLGLVGEFLVFPTMLASNGGEFEAQITTSDEIDTYNEYDNKTAIVGENSNGSGMLSTFNNSSKQTALIGSIDGGNGKLTIFDNEGRESLHLVRSLTTFNQDGKITGKYGTNNSGNGSVFLYDRFGNRGWYKSGKSS